MTLLFIGLGLVVGLFVLGGILAFLPSSTLGRIEKHVGKKIEKKD